MKRIRAFIDRCRDQELFITRTAGPWCGPGEIYVKPDGSRWRITRRVEDSYISQMVLGVPE